MNETIQIISGLFQTGVISFVVYMIIKGLKTEIQTLQSQISTQNKTIETMDKRIQETEKIGELYKKLISDFPQALDDYQETITKTKDRTIYELKSTLEEKELTIENLKDQTKSNDPKKIERAASITKLFLNRENKSLLEFLEKLHTDKDLIINTILENDDFNFLIQSLNYHLIVVEYIDARELIGENYFSENKIRTMTSMIGSQVYYITFDSEIKISSSLYQNFCNTYNSLK
jgi:chromosome segregation ATPase